MWFLGAAQRIIRYSSNLFFLSPDDGCLCHVLKLVGVSGEPWVRAYDNGDDTMAVMVSGGGEVNVPVPGLECYSGFLRAFAKGYDPLVRVMVGVLVRWVFETGFVPLDAVIAYDGCLIGCEDALSGAHHSVVCERQE